MSNEVKIVVTSTDKTDFKPAEARARAAGRRSGDAYVEGVGKGASRAGDRIADSMEQGAERGKSALASLADSTGRLDRRIDEARNSVAELAAEYARAENKDVFKALQSARSGLANLELVRKELKRVEKQADDTADEMSKSGKKSGKGFLSGIGSSMRSGATSAVKGFVGTFTSNGQAALIAGAVAIGASFIGALSGALMAGAAGGAIGLGALLLKDRPAVVRAAASMASAVGNAIKGAAAPLEGPFVRALGSIQSAMTGFAPLFNRVFSAVAPMVGKLTDSLLKAASSILPAFERAIGSSGPVVDALAQGIESMGQTTAQVFDILTSDPEESAQAITGLITAVNNLAIALALIAKGAQTLFNPMMEAVSKSRETMTGWGEQIARLPGPVGDLAQKLLDEAGALDKSTAATQSQASASETAAQAADRQRQAVAALANQLLALSGSEMAVEQAIDDASAAARKNGRTLDINTAKGRANRTALNGIASSFQSYSASAKAAGTSTSQVSRVQDRAYHAFVKTARGAGMTKGAADRLARSYGLLPASKTTRIRAVGAGAAVGSIRSVLSALASIPGSRTVYVNVKAAYHYGMGQSNFLRSLGQATGGVTRKAATGGPRGNRVLVGESGPELVNLPTGSTVYPSGNRRIQQDYNGGGGRVTLELRSSGKDIDDLLMKVLSRAISVRGGNVQLAIGKRASVV